MAAGRQNRRLVVAQCRRTSSRTWPRGGCPMTSTRTCGNPPPAPFPPSVRPCTLQMQSSVSLLVCRGQLMSVIASGSCTTALGTTTCYSLLVTLLIQSHNWQHPFGNKHLAILPCCSGAAVSQQLHAWRREERAVQAQLGEQGRRRRRRRCRQLQLRRGGPVDARRGSPAGATLSGSPRHLDRGKSYPVWKLC